jgi:flagella basal body P-ring formation protein FlgA
MTSFASRAFIAFMILGCGAAQAAPPAVPADLEGAVTAGIAEAWGVDPSALTVEWGLVPAPVREPGATLLRLAGRGTDGWLAAVIRPAGGRTLSVRVRAGLEDSVWVAAHPLEPGTVLAAADLRGQQRLRWGPPRAAYDRPGPGWEVRRRLPEGAELAAPAVAPPTWVTAGEPVVLEWSRGGVNIALAGTALNSAREGETVRARVPGRDAPVSGTVTGPGTAALRAAG